jgi:hypothetical protein
MTETQPRHFDAVLPKERNPFCAVKLRAPWEGADAPVPTPQGVQPLSLKVGGPVAATAGPFYSQFGRISALLVQRQSVKAPHTCEQCVESPAS